MAASIGLATLPHSPPMQIAGFPAEAFYLGSQPAAKGVKASGDENLRIPRTLVVLGLSSVVLC